jgi:hypothetical protein
LSTLKKDLEDLGVIDMEINCNCINRFRIKFSEPDVVNPLG